MRKPIRPAPRPSGPGKWSDEGPLATVPRETISVEELAKRLGLARSTTYAYLNSGVLKCRRVGDHFLITEADVQRLLKA